MRFNRYACICMILVNPTSSLSKRIIRYLQGTLHHGLFIRLSYVDRLVSYSDADWVGCPLTRRSTSGFCVYLGDNLVSWSSKRQHVVSRSSAEAEYRGVANVVAETAWLRNLLLECHYLASNPVQHQTLLEKVQIATEICYGCVIRSYSATEYVTESHLSGISFCLNMFERDKSHVSSSNFYALAPLLPPFFLTAVGHYSPSSFLDADDLYLHTGDFTDALSLSYPSYQPLTFEVLMLFRWFEEEVIMSTESSKKKGLKALSGIEEIVCITPLRHLSSEPISQTEISQPLLADPAPQMQDVLQYECGHIEAKLAHNSINILGFTNEIAIERAERGKKKPTPRSRALAFHAEERQMVSERCARAHNGVEGCQIGLDHGILDPYRSALNSLAPPLLDSTVDLFEYDSCEDRDEYEEQDCEQEAYIRQHQMVHYGSYVLVLHSAYELCSSFCFLNSQLQYLTFTRPDIAYAVQQVCLYMHDPREPYFLALKAYHTLSSGYPSSWSVYTSVLCRSFGLLFGCRLGWLSSDTPVHIWVPVSSAEAEYRGVANVVAETAWLRNLLLFFGNDGVDTALGTRVQDMAHRSLRPTVYTTLVAHEEQPTATWETPGQLGKGRRVLTTRPRDHLRNLLLECHYLASNPVQHQRTKHVEIDLHFVRERIAIGQVHVLHVPSAHQFADIFTKGLPTQLFLDFRDSLSIREPPAQTEGEC
ncbi:hypothetical protein LXL04_006428 [Taraxacum kok-saghyz]